MISSVREREQPHHQRNQAVSRADESFALHTIDRNIIEVTADMSWAAAKWPTRLAT